MLSKTRHQKKKLELVLPPDPAPSVFKTACEAQVMLLGAGLETKSHHPRAWPQLCTGWFPPGLVTPPRWCRRCWEVWALLTSVTMTPELMYARLCAWVGVCDHTAALLATRHRTAPRSSMANAEMFLPGRFQGQGVFQYDPRANSSSTGNRTRGKHPRPCQGIRCYRYHNKPSGSPHTGTPCERPRSHHNMLLQQAKRAEIWQEESRVQPPFVVVQHSTPSEHTVSSPFSPQTSNR